MANSGFRVSPTQRHLWSVARDSGIPLWGQLPVHLDGDVDLARLETAVRAVGERHEALRTTFTGAAGSTLVQTVADAPAGIAVHYDRRDHAELPEVYAAERAALSAAEPARVALVRLDAGEWVLLLTAHPAVADRRSLRLVLTEIAAGYGGTAPGAEPPIQYADYATWHHELLADPSRDAERDYWDGHVDPALRGWTTEIGGTATTGPEWETRRLPLGADLTDRVAATARRLGLDVAALYATTWSALLWRLAGERDIAVPATVAGRSYPELEQAVGPYARDLPVVCRFDTAADYAAQARRVAAVLAEATERADDLDPNRLGPPMADAGFEYLDDAAPITVDGLTFRPAGEAARGGPQTITLRGGRGAEGLWVELCHDTAAVGGQRAQELVQRFVAMLRAVAEAPDTAVGAVGALLDGERERLVAAGHGPAASYPGGGFDELFAAQAARSPQAVALTCGERSLTYAELDSRANRLAHHLIDRGVRPGAKVVLYLERSPELLVGLLAVLKAGAAYVPVDVGHPWRRLEFVLSDVDAPLLLTGRDTAAALPAPAVPVVLLDDAEVVTGPDTTPAVATGPDDLAYIMYTSGTTGVPAGVAVPHRGLVNYLTWAADAYDLRSGSGTLVHSSVGFDLTLTALLGPLLVGQRAVLLPERAGVAGLVSALRSGSDISLVKLTPTHLQMLTRLMDPAELADRVRTLVVGGENLTADTVRPIAGGVRVVNEYGPTETVVGSCAYEIPPAAAPTGSVPIGRPIANTRIYLLDAAGQPVPDGMPGEIYLGGDGLADGYLNRPELTQQRFVADPYRPGARLYRTGDRARRRPGGDLVYLGRSDDQIKVRGVRVEPGEIEAVLRRHPDIEAAAVAAIHDPDGPVAADTRLVAYLVAVAGHTVPSAAEVIDLCRELLPEQLVPNAVVALSALPSTANGKLDRTALRRMRPGRPDAGEFHPPTNPTEEILAGAVAAVLGLERVGIDDNYFVLGGDSIRSVMVASRAAARGVEVTAADLHGHPTVRTCAAALQAQHGRADEPRTEPFSLVSAADRALMPAEVADAFPLNLLQEGMIFHRDFAAKSAVYHAIASVRLRAPFDLEVLRLVIHQLVERHPMLRTSFDMTSFSRPLQLVHSVFRDPLHYEDLRGLPAGEQDRRVAEWVGGEKERGFELDEFPLIRFMAQPLDDETFQFTYGFHHEIVDGWSEALMVTELFTHYLSIMFDEPVAPRPPTSTMRDAVALELAALQQQESYEFWSRYLADATLMRLPRLDSGPRADKGARDIVRVAVPVPVELSDTLKRLARQSAVPLKSVLLAAHMRVMCQYNGQTDTLTYTVTNGRPETADGSTAIGLFVNSLALRLDLAGGSWRELISQTLETERASMPYRRLPMAELKRHQGNEPLAETLFFFTDYHVFQVLERWQARGVEHVESELYGESTFPFCAIFRLNRDTSHLEIRIEYDRLQFPVELIESMADCYQRVLAAMTADPDAAYHLPELLSGQERRQTVTGWNDTHTELPADVCVHELIERQAQATPDAVALEHGDAAVSYRELMRRSGRVARLLQSQGVGPETPVAIVADRSIEMIVCILGVLRAGGAYVPVDPGNPDERIAVVLADAAPAVVLVQQRHAARVGSGRFAVVEVDPGLAVAAGYDHRPAPTAVAPDSAAYVLYTSGSAGKPKGVLVPHRSLVGSTLARRRTYAAPPDRFLLLSPFAFDSSVAGIFWSLCEGGTLVLPREGIQLEPAELARHIGRTRVTHTLGVPSLFLPLVEQADAHALASLRVLIAAGEACPKELFDECRRVLPAAALYNEYGPTEGTVWSTVWTGEPIAHRPQLPIGRPIANAAVYLLNPHLNPVPVGVAGEMYLGGAGLARGYLGPAAATAASFQPDPFGTTPGARMYRTGDLACHTLHGDLDFLGRADGQVKIRGFRVELGEIEGLLDTHPSVRRSVVLAREDAGGEKLLVGYVVARHEHAPDPAELQAYVRDRLPKYMVPATFVVLDALPLTATGKVDRGSLPAPDRSQRRRAASVSPRTEMEQMLAALWCQVLGLDNVGVTDDFFDLGGESLRAMQVVTKTNKIFGLELSVRSLFETATIAAFAAVVETARRQASNGEPARRPAMAVEGRSHG